MCEKYLRPRRLAIRYRFISIGKVRRGPAGLCQDEEYKLSGALKVVKYLLSKVPVNRAKDFENEVKDIVSKYVTTPALKTVLTQISGFVL